MRSREIRPHREKCYDDRTSDHSNHRTQYVATLNPSLPIDSDLKYRLVRAVMHLAAARWDFLKGMLHTLKAPSVTWFYIVHHRDVDWLQHRQVCWSKRILWLHLLDLYNKNLYLYRTVQDTVTRCFTSWQWEMYKANNRKWLKSKRGNM